MRKRMLIFSLLSILVLAGCGNGEKKTEKKGEGAQKTEQSSAAVESGEELPKGVEARNTFTISWEENWHDLIVSITDVSIVMLEEGTEEADLLDGNTMIGVKFEVVNNSDRTITTYPDQAILVVNGKQYNTNILLGDSVGGDVLSKSNIEGVVVFDTSHITDVDEVKEIRLSWSAYDSDYEDYEDMNKDFDVTLQLEN